MMSDPKVLWEAEFSEKVKGYYLWSTVLILVICIVTIPIAVLYIFIGNVILSKYLENLSCTLTERTLEIKKGILNKRESTVPLEKITDLQMFQGPIMRYCGLHGFRVETAGQSSGSAGGSLVNMIGIIDTPGFRKAVLDQRDRLHAGAAASSASTSPEPTQSSDELIEAVTEIRDALHRIETKLESRNG
jgi:membrane protein YdbS with pleckstrin-like domain